MLRFVLPVVLLPVSFLATAPAPAFAQAQQRLQPEPAQVAVVNRTDRTLQNLFVTPVTNPAWGDDRLGSQTVEAGGRFRLRPPGRDCVFDVRGVFANGAEDVRFGVNLCRTRELALTGETQAPPRRDGPVALYQVRNTSRVTIATLGVAPPGGRPVDVLGVTVLGAGQIFTGRVRREGPCVNDVTAGYSQGEPETRSGVNLCTAGELVFEGPRPPPSGAMSEVTINNLGTSTIQVIHIRPAGASSWGEDRLGSDILRAGRSSTLRVGRAPTQCAFDVRVRYDGGGEETRTRVDLCTTTALDFVSPEVAGRGQAKERARSNDGPAQVSDVTIINLGRHPIQGVSISSSRVDEWGENLIEAPIEPGARRAIPVTRDGQCDFDILVEWRGGREDRRMRQNICARAEFAFGGSEPPTIDGGGVASGRRVLLVNNGRDDIMEIFATPTNDTHWGDDRLGANILPPRARLSIRVRPDACRVDLRIVYRGGATQERRDQDLCTATDLAIGRAVRPGSIVSTGTGFYVSTSGHILTNQHVIDGCTSVAYSRADGRRVMLRVVAQDEDTDLALLREDSPTPTPAAALRLATQPIRAGDRVVLVGYPVRQRLGGVIVTEGLVSALRGERGSAERLQYTAPTQPGNSGGPIFDEHGLVVGVVVAQLDKLPDDRRAQNINFGIQLETVRQFLAKQNLTAPEQAPGAILRPAEILEQRQPMVLPLDCLS